ncbi:MAG: hypothetical protein LBP40_04570 [Campylobacteraceae bacterium]|nr:hypothetical protein [Campylobacteraceae bacterium]
MSDVENTLVDMDIIGGGDTPQYASTVGITERLQDAMIPSSDYTWDDVKGYGKKVEKAKDKFEKDTGKEKDADIWNYSMGMSYSSEKTLATLGQGSIMVRDKDNSDELNSLNRDMDSMNNLLYSGGIGLDVESVTKGALANAIKGLVTSAFEIGDAFQIVGETDNIFDVASSVLDVADGVLTIKNNVNTINIVLNQPKENDANKDIGNQDKNTFANTAETTLIALIEIRNGIKDIASSSDDLINMDIQKIYLKDNVYNINNFINGIQNIDHGLNQNNYIKNYFFDKSSLRYILDKVYDINKVLRDINKVNQK